MLKHSATHKPPHWCCINLPLLVTTEEIPSHTKSHTSTATTYHITQSVLLWTILTPSSCFSENPKHPRRHFLLLHFPPPNCLPSKMPSILLSALANMTTERLRPIMLDATTTAMPPITKTTTTMFHNLSSAGSHAAQNKRPTIIIYPTGELTQSALNRTLQYGNAGFYCLVGRWAILT